VNIQRLCAAIAAVIAATAGLLGILDSHSAKAIGAYLWPGWVVGILAAVAACEAALAVRGKVQASARQVAYEQLVSQFEGSDNGGVTGFPNDFAAVQAMLSYLDGHLPRTVDFLEYSSIAVTAVLSKISEADSTSRIRLLVCHPDCAISDYQLDHRLAEGLRALAYRIPADRARDIGLQIKCYSERASLRGRHFDDVLVVAGWYTYDHRRRAQPLEEEISGGSNALVWADTTHTTGECIAGTFVKTFENIWNSAEPADDAWRPYRNRISNLPSADWFRAVRPHDVLEST
jgi:hypothetical protein